MNKYEKTPDRIIDIHGYTIPEAEILLDELVSENRHGHVRVITGKGNHGPNGAVIRTFVKEYFNQRSIRFNQSKIQDGGEGAMEVFLD